MKQLFKTGTIVETRGIAERCAKDPLFSELVIRALQMHCSGNWGDLDDDDWRSNQEALRTGEDRLFSAYYMDDAKSEKIWIITEWDRSVTTILFPHEY